MSNLGKQRGYIRTGNPYRRIRWFPQWKESMSSSPRADALKGEIGRASSNAPIQGSNADAVKLALCLVQKAIDTEGWDARIILVVHDEIQCECKEEQAENFKYRLEELMKEALGAIVKSIPVVVDCKVADCWSK